jgi:hypothetical protein
MDVRTAQRAGGSTSADRVFVSSCAVVVLDGASAFEPVGVSADVYSEHLGGEIAAMIDDDRTPIRVVVARAIERSADALDLRRGSAPSSTVAALRVQPDGRSEFYVLGDSPVYYSIQGTQHRLVDERLDDVAAAERASYVEHLRAGDGYGPQHWQRLAVLQQAQRALRNCHGGYWIAEADPQAAAHAVTRSYPPGALQWAVLASDGAADGIEAAGIDWSAIVHYSRDQLDQTLANLHRWESDVDPDGRLRPRAKRHDDKTLAIVRLGR